MSISLKYAVVERERRFLLASLPEGIDCTRQIIDRYLTGTRLRLREVREADLRAEVGSYNAVGGARDTMWVVGFDGLVAARDR